MIISFLDGSKVVEPDVEVAISYRLRQLIKTADTVDFYFYTTTDFMLECEWLVRKLQAYFPEKQIRRNVVLDAENEWTFSRCRFDRSTRVDCQKAVDVWRWMVDQSDYICGYMHPQLCASRARLIAWNYAEKTKPGCCFNFASEAAWRRVYEQIPKLVSWQREAFVRKLNKERQSDIARLLGVSQSTVHLYEMSAKHSLAEKAYSPVTPHRTCALLGFTATIMEEEQKKLLSETLWYLIRKCYVDNFLVQYAVECQRLPVMQIVSSLNRRLAIPVKISADRPAESVPALIHVRTGNGHIDRGLKEREAMIAGADIVLCYIENLYGSGINYAKRKHIPVINLAEAPFNTKEALS